MVAIITVGLIYRFLIVEHRVPAVIFIIFFRDSPFHRNLNTANKYTHMHTQTITHILDTVNCFPSWSRGRLRAKKMKTKQRSTTSMRSVIFIRCPVLATFVRTFLRFCDGVSSWWTKTYKSKCPRIDVLVYASVLRTAAKCIAIIWLSIYIAIYHCLVPGCVWALERERERIAVVCECYMNGIRLRRR